MHRLREDEADADDEHEESRDIRDGQPLILVFVRVESRHRENITGNWKYSTPLGYPKQHKEKRVLAHSPISHDQLAPPPPPPPPLPALPAPEDEELPPALAKAEANDVPNDDENVADENPPAAPLKDAPGTTEAFLYQ